MPRIRTLTLAVAAVLSCHSLAEAAAQVEDASSLLRRGSLNQLPEKAQDASSVEGAGVPPVHKPLFQGAVGADIGAAVLIFLVSGLALSAGIGGGGLYVPLLVLALGFEVHQAAALSQSCLAGGALSALIYNVRQRHPSGKKPLIDYNMALIMLPFLLVGALIGSTLNGASPSWLIVLVLTAVLLHSLQTTYTKAMTTWRKEQAAASDSNTAGKGPLLAGAQQGATAQQEKRQYPPLPIVGLGVMWSVLVLDIFLRGGPADPGLVPYCSPPYWGLAAATASVLAVLGTVAAKRAVTDSSSRETAGGDAGGEMIWTAQTAKGIAAWSLVAGTIAALCGIGGGMIIGPKLLALGFQAQVGSATTATMLFVMASSTALFFLVQGTAPIDYTLYVAFTAALGASVGKALVDSIVKRYRRPSIIMFLLGGIIAASVVVMVITGVITVYHDYQAGANLLFRSPCAGESA